MAAKKINCPSCRRLVPSAMDYCPFCSEKLPTATSNEERTVPETKKETEFIEEEDNSVENFNINELEFDTGQPTLTRTEQAPVPDYFEDGPSVENSANKDDNRDQDLKKSPKTLFNPLKKKRETEETSTNEQNQEQNSVDSAVYYEEDNIPWEDKTKSKADKSPKYSDGIYNPNHDGMYDDTLPRIKNELENLRTGKERTLLKIIFGIIAIIGIIIYLILTI